MPLTVPVHERILVLVGTRPEVIKLAPVIKELQQRKAEVVVCATGQHTDMAFPILDWFGIVPDFKLDVMSHQQPLSHLAGKLLSGLYDVIEEVNPDLVVVQGDTTSAMIGALAAFYSYDHFWKNQLRSTPIEVAHVEAGLRTGNPYSPYPEEMNRHLIGHVATWHFAPTLEAASALQREGVTHNVFVTGNTVIDALLETRTLLKERKADPLPFVPKDRKIILVTSHRRENYGQGLQEICFSVRDLARRYHDQGFDIVYPVHLNQHVQKPVHALLAGVPGIHLIPPQGYPEFVSLMDRSHLVLTDSGGVQEEAPSLGKPILVMRNDTERPEAITAGCARLVGAHAETIVAESCAILDNAGLYNRMARAANPYGDGKSSQRIVNLLYGKCSEDNTFIYRPGADS